MIDPGRTHPKRRNPWSSLAFIAASLALGAVTWADNEDEQEYLRSKGYVSLSAGLTIPDESDVLVIFEDLSGDPLDAQVFDTDIEYDPGLALIAAIGHEVFYPLRVELEFSFRSNDIDGANSTPTAAMSADGDVESVSLMVNVLADIPIHDNIGLYFGGGVGGSRVDVDVQAAFEIPTDPTITGVGLDGDDIIFTYQLMGGLFFRLNESVILNVGYRAVVYDDLDVTGNFYEMPTLHAAEFGIRFEF